MAFLVSDPNSFSSLRSKTQVPTLQPRREFHIELGQREKDLLADDPALKNFKSYKPTVRRIRKIGNVVTVAVVAACFYEIYQHAVSRT